MSDKLKCQICEELVNNNLIELTDHISTHISDYEEEAERENQDVDEWVLSYFDSIDTSVFALGDIMKCTVCGQECFEDAYPEVVFRDDKNCICECCSIDYEEVGDKIQLRQDM